MLHSVVNCSAFYISFYQIKGLYLAWKNRNLGVPISEFIASMTEGQQRL